MQPACHEQQHSRQKNHQQITLEGGGGGDLLNLGKIVDDNSSNVMDASPRFPEMAMD
jgi:hypothetical protein